MITLITSKRSPIGKSFDNDRKIKPLIPQTYFDFETKKFKTLQELQAFKADMTNMQAFVVGHPINFETLDYVDRLENVHRVKDLHNFPTLKERETTLLSLDVDCEFEGITYNTEALVNEAAIKFRDSIPFLQNTDMAISPTSSCGLPRKGLRVRLCFLLAKECLPSEMARHFKAYEDIDSSLFIANQIHYVARPFFDNPSHDLFKKRFWVSKGTKELVTLPTLPKLPPKVEQPIVTIKITDPLTEFVGRCLEGKYLKHKEALMAVLTLKGHGMDANLIKKATLGEDAQQNIKKGMLKLEPNQEYFRSYDALLKYVIGYDNEFEASQLASINTINPEECEPVLEFLPVEFIQEELEKEIGSFLKDGAGPLLIAPSAGTGKSQTTCKIVAGLTETVNYFTETHALAAQVVEDIRSFGGVATHIKGMVHFVDEKEAESMVQVAREHGVFWFSKTEAARILITEEARYTYEDQFEGPGVKVAPHNYITSRKLATAKNTIIDENCISQFVKFNSFSHKECQEWQHFQILINKIVSDIDKPLIDWLPDIEELLEQEPVETVSFLKWRSSLPEELMGYAKPVHGYRKKWLTKLHDSLVKNRPNQAYLTNKYVSTKHQSVRTLCIGYSKVPQLKDTRVLLLDATAEPLIVEQFFPGLKTLKYHVEKHPDKQVEQCYSSRYSKSRLRNRLQNAMKPYADYEVITSKEFKGDVGAEHHFGALRGLNALKESDKLLILGTYKPNTIADELLTKAIWYEEPDDISMKHANGYEYFHFTNGTCCRRVNSMHYQDEKVETVRRLLVSENYQAVERARTCRPGPMFIEILGNQGLPMQIDAIFHHHTSRVSILGDSLALVLNSREIGHKALQKDIREGNDLPKGTKGGTIKKDKKAKRPKYFLAKEDVSELDISMELAPIIKQKDHRKVKVQFV